MLYSASFKEVAMMYEKTQAKDRHENTLDVITIRMTEASRRRHQSQDDDEEDQEVFNNYRELSYNFK